MSYDMKLNKDLNVIHQFRNFQDFQVYPNINCTKSKILVKLKDLKPYLVQKNVEKLWRNLIVINPTSGPFKTQEFYKLPHTLFLDLDLHTEEQAEQFCADMGCNNIQDALRKAYDILVDLNICYYIDYSQGGNGIHAFINILSDYYVENYYAYQPSENIDVINILLEENFKVLVDVLAPHGFKFYNNEIIDYIDKGVACTINKNALSSNGNNIIINNDAYIIQHKIDSINEKIEEKEKLKEYRANIDVTKLKELNNVFAENLIRYIKKVNNNHQEMNAFLEDIKPHFAHYNISLLFSLKHLDVKHQNFFYYLLHEKKWYRGKSLRKFLRTFETFRKYLNKLKEEYAIPLAYCLSDVELFPRNSTEYDFFVNKYHQVLSYRKYITEQKEKLFEQFLKHPYIVLKAVAGGGKSTLIFEFIQYCMENNLFSRIVLCSTKNGLSKQQKQILFAKYPNLRIVQNFEKGKRYNPRLYQPTDKLLILSSSPKISLVTDADLIIVDEIQNLVNYSGEIVSNFDRRIKTILLSATPEPYLIFEKGYYYINLMKEKEKKKTLNVIVSNRFKKTLKKLVQKGQKCLIFFNNVDLSKEYIQEIEMELGIKFDFLNAETKNMLENLDCILKEKLLKNYYMATSYISDGINFNNETWDKLIILDNCHLNVFEIYQLSNRFRIAKPQLYLVTKPRGGRDKDFNFDIAGFRDMEYFNKRVQELTQRLHIINLNPEINKNDQLIKEQYFVKDINNLYVLNLDRIKKEVFDNYYFVHYDMNSDVFEQSLKYYFKLKRVFELSDDKDVFVKDTKLNDFFRAHCHDIHDAISVDRSLENLKYYTNIKLSGETLTFVKDNLSYFQKIHDRCYEIVKRGFDWTDYVDVVTGKQQNYTKFINNLNLKALDRCKKEDADKKLDGLGLEYYNKQELLYQIIVNSGLVKKTSKGNDYFELLELIEYFQKDENKSIYENFKKVDDYYFKLNGIDLGRYINKISRYFKSKLVTVNKYTFRIVIINHV